MRFLDVVFSLEVPGAEHLEESEEGAEQKRLARWKVSKEGAMFKKQAG